MSGLSHIIFGGEGQSQQQYQSLIGFNVGVASNLVSLNEKKDYLDGITYRGKIIDLSHIMFESDL